MTKYGMMTWIATALVVSICSPALAADPTEAGGAGEGNRAAPSAPKGMVYLLSFFKANGQDGLHFASSEDGLNWQAVSEKSFLRPQVGGKLMRDPSIVKGPDGTYRMVWTTGWWVNHIGYSSSKDLVHWSEQKTIPVMTHEKEVRNSWAPEVFCDKKTERFLIVWSSTIPGRFPKTDGTSESGLNHRMYYTTTTDFEDFAPTKLFFDPGHSVIDGYIAHDDANDRYLLFYKDERRFPEPKKTILMGTSDKAEGPYKPAAAPIVPRNWVEGPSAIKLPDRWIVYFDCYKQRRYGAACSTDLADWEDITKTIQFPAGTRHGTVLLVPKEILERLKVR